MYIVDFAKRMVRKSNVAVLIYLILNVFLIGVVVTVVFALPFWAGMLIGLALYALSVTIALSPFGEWLLRKQNGCNEITRIEQQEYLYPLFQEVYGRAKHEDPTIPDDVQLFINDDECPNAFATGRKTICVTKGLLQVPPEEIKATLGHEFGHIAHKDTDLILVVTVGNMIVNLIIFGIRIFIWLVHLVLQIASIFIGGAEGFVASIAESLYHLLITAIVFGLTQLWTWIGTMLVMKSSRGNEYEADEFSFRLGYGDELCALLDNIDSSGAKGLFATLVSSHPAKDDRIAHLQALGSAYRSGYGAGIPAGQPQVLPFERPMAEIPASQPAAAQIPLPQAAAVGFAPSQTAVAAVTAKCTVCGAELEEGAKFCSSCGAPVLPAKKLCPNCGCEVEDNDAFCANCGTKLN